MPPRTRRLLLSTALLGLFVGCAHRPPAARDVTSLFATDATHQSSLTASSLASAPPPATRRSIPGTPFTRARPLAPFDPALVVTTQVAHDDIFLHTLPLGPDPTGPAINIPNPASVPRYQSTLRLYRGQRAFILPFARNYAFDALERTDLTFELFIRKPDGSLDGPPLSASLWQDSVATPDLLLYPATTVSFYAEPRDPLGDYRLVVHVHDHLGETTREFTHTLTLVEYTPPALPADFDTDRWFHGYYLAPAPELALPALSRFFEKLPADKRSGAIPPLLGFYDQILADNPWLLPAFAARCSTAAPDEAFALSLVLGFHLRATPAPPPAFPTPLWERLADFRTHAWPADPDAPLLQAAQLDALWGRFFASALYAPVQRLLEPLAHTDDLGAAERWRKSLPAPDSAASSRLPDLDDPATPPEIRREILLRTALWSLRANARQHPLVRSYLEQSLRTGDLAPGVRILLERALRQDPTPAAPSAAPAS